MCFIVHPEYPDPLVTEQDIVCFKVGYEAEISLFGGYFTSEYRGYKYRLKRLQPLVELCLYNNTKTGTIEINKGYHSYHPLHPFAQSGFDATSKFCLVRCIIPKGSQYYYNPNDQEYVSDQIIAQKIL